MKKECCRTCSHHIAVQIRVDVDEDTGEETPVFNHFCDGKRIQESMVKDFRCGMYEELTL